MRDWNWEIMQMVRKFPMFHSERKKRTTSGGTWSAFHLVENSENSGLGVNGKRFFGSPDWKISGKSGTAQKVVPFSRLERPDWFLPFQLHFPVIFTSSRPTAAKFSPPFCNKMASTMMYQCSCCLLATHSMEHLLKHDCTSITIVVGNLI